MKLPKILQNQESFSTEEYRRRATPLVDVLERKGVPCWISDLRNNGFFAGVLMYLCAGEYDAAVTVSHRPAMVYGFLSRIAPRKGTIHIAKEFFFEGESAGRCTVKNRILSALYRFSLKNVDAVIVNARAEITPYACELELPKDRFIFIPWPSNIEKPEMFWEHDESIFAVGRSLRDWNTFFRAVEGLSLRCVVVASRADVADLKVPTNVELHCDISRDRYLDLLRQAKIVVLPLKETLRSTGQASFLEAMAYGKPVIVAGVSGVWDYITDKRNGLIYSPGDADVLRSAVNKLNNEETLRRSIACTGFDDIIARFNKKNYADNMLKVIDSLSAGRTA